MKNRFENKITWLECVESRILYLYAVAFIVLNGIKYLKAFKFLWIKYVDNKIASWLDGVKKLKQYSIFTLCCFFLITVSLPD